MKVPVAVSPEEFSADRRRADGGRSFWATSAGGSSITRWDFRDGAWSESSTSTAASWTAAVAADVDVRTIGPDEITDFTAPDADPLLELLTLTGDGDPHDQAWSFDVDDWETEDEDFTFEEGQVRRYAHVNGQRIHFLKSDRSFIAIVADEDLIGGTQIAQLVWNNGGDPASGYLYSVRSGVAVGLERSESIHQIRGFRHDTDPPGVAAMLDSWLHFADGFGTGGGAAAVALEPFDPNGTLTPEQRAAWDEALAEQLDGWDYTFRVSFDASEAVIDEFRAILAAEDEGYRRVRDALANPVEGDWLREQLAAGQTEALW